MKFRKQFKRSREFNSNERMKTLLYQDSRKTLIHSCIYRHGLYTYCGV